MSSMGEQKLHFVLVPLMAQGHVIPMVDLARLLAERGALVTLVATPLNVSRLKAAADSARASGLPIRFVPIPFPCAEVGLPEGCENVDLLPTGEMVTNFFRGNTLMRHPLQRYLRENPPLPHCVVSDVSHPWTRGVADEFGVPRFIFYPICCFTLQCQHNLMHHGVFDKVADAMEPVLVPDVPHRVEVTMAQAPGFFPGDDWKEFHTEAEDAELTCDGAIVNSFDGLDPFYIEAFEKAKGKKTWAVGPVSMCNKDDADKASRGDKASVDVEHCMSWLESMKPRSVLYVSLGSLARTPLPQVVELGTGLEASNYPFIWVIKPGDQYAEVEEWLADGFEERTKERGIIIWGWAPQLMILSHPSVGGFLTHCGWNSSLEGVAAGVPMVTWPAFADQFLNERFIVDVLRVGVPVGVKVPAWWGLGNSDALVKREEVEKAVQKLMDCGTEGEERRGRATELGKMARSAMEVGGSSHANLTSFIDQVMELAMNRKNA
uniref:Glycosyltransferase n=1 Tax=Anthurium amnicola TaxID=1678845 RepID=A0A1D1YA38_9ARAE